MSVTSNIKTPVVEEVAEQSEISPEPVPTVVPPPVNMQEMQQVFHQIQTTLGLLVEVINQFINAGLKKEDETTDDKVNCTLTRQLSKSKSSSRNPC
jgi:hypothetical protein